MKVCVPVDMDNGMDSIPGMSFRDANFFIVHDTGSGRTESVDITEGNEDWAGDPMKALRSLSVEALITGDLDDETLKTVTALGIKAYRAMPGTVQGNVEVLKLGDLEELRPGPDVE